MDGGKNETDRLERIEALLEQQVELGRKTLRSSRIHTVLLILFAVLLAIGIGVVGTTLSQAAAGLPAALESISGLADTAAVEIGRLDEFDIAALNEVVEGLASIRFDVLNESIQALTDIIKPFVGFMGAFS
jgi:hypothetical protein